MFSILHRVGIKSATTGVYPALATKEGLAAWWTTDTRGSCAVGEVIQFVFGNRGFMHMKVVEADGGKRIAWLVVDGPQDWIGTTVSFDLKQEGEQTTVLFKHEGWKEQTEFMHHCSTKWATFLMSLKAWVENAQGRPFPEDVLISINWD